MHRGQDDGGAPAQMNHVEETDDAIARVWNTTAAAEAAAPPS